MKAADARLLARPILQEYDAFTVDELAMNPAESGKLAARQNLVEIAEACWREAKYSQATILFHPFAIVIVEGSSTNDLALIICVLCGVNFADIVNNIVHSQSVAIARLQSRPNLQIAAFSDATSGLRTITMAASRVSQWLNRNPSGRFATPL